MRVKIKIRHRHDPAWATLEPAPATELGAPGPSQLGTGDSKSVQEEILATFDEPQRAVTPGQSAVFYDSDEVVGGGWIV
jgi:tRNA-specific 2-thiouridylase